MKSVKTPKRTKTPQSERTQVHRKVALFDEYLTRRAREEFRIFVQLAWPIIEPGTPLQSNWHVDFLCEHLQAITEGHARHVVINLPPRHMKSILVSVLWPVWEWIRRPSGRWLFLSHSESLAAKHALDRRRVIESDWYQQRWGHIVRLARDQRAKTDVRNTRNGAMFATSMGGSVTGKGANRLVVDDPHSPEQAESDAQRRQVVERILRSGVTRLDDKRRDVIVVLMQRLHVEDLSGVCLNLGFDHVCLPALVSCETTYRFPLSGRVYVRAADEPLWPAREDRTQLEAQRALMGSYAWAGQYQQEPVPRVGSMFPREWWGFYERAPEHFDQVIISWDLAVKDGPEHDWAVGLVAGRIGAKIYLLDRFKARVAFVDACRAIERMVAQYPATSVVLIEDAANGPAVVNLLQSRIRGLIAVSPEGGKLARAAAVQPMIEAGQILLPAVRLANGEYCAARRWVEDFIDVCAVFPRGAYDDDVDALTQLLVWWHQHTSVLPCSAIREPEPVFRSLWEPEPYSPLARFAELAERRRRARPYYLQR